MKAIFHKISEPKQALVALVGFFTNAFMEASMSYLLTQSVFDFQRPIEIDAAFGNWFAGFVDGEGCFHIGMKHHRSNHISYGLTFHIGLRSDDLPILEEIKTTLGIGKVRRPRQGKIGNPQSRYVIASKNDCARLVEILDTYPLRAKKTRDYSIWREALFTWNKIRRMSPSDQRGGVCVGFQNKLAELKQKLEATREFFCPDCEGEQNA